MSRGGASGFAKIAVAFIVKNAMIVAATALNAEVAQCEKREKLAPQLATTMGTIIFGNALTVIETATVKSGNATIAVAFIAMNATQPPGSAPNATATISLLSDISIDQIPLWGYFFIYYYQSSV